MECILSAENLTKTFVLSKKQQKLNKTNEKLKVAVNNLSFSTYKGEIFGLLGPNGAGKTTTLRMISTLIKPDSGDVTIKGISVVENPEKAREHIGFLTSDLKLEDFFTPSYLFDFFANLHGMTEQQAKERKTYLFEKFGINKFAEVKVANLSTGMRQKVSLIISVIHNPEIVIFDEPTNGLDVLTAKVVTDFLMELKAAGKTIILSTHIFSLVEKLCDRVGIIINGKMAASGTIEEVAGESSIEDKFFELYEQNSEKED